MLEKLKSEEFKTFWAYLGGASMLLLSSLFTLWAMDSNKVDDISMQIICYACVAGFIPAVVFGFIDSNKKYNKSHQSNSGE